MSFVEVHAKTARRHIMNFGGLQGMQPKDMFSVSLVYLLQVFAGLDEASAAADIRQSVRADIRSRCHSHVLALGITDITVSRISKLIFRLKTASENPDLGNRLGVKGHLKKIGRLAEVQDLALARRQAYRTAAACIDHADKPPCASIATRALSPAFCPKHADRLPICTCQACP